MLTITGKAVEKAKRILAQMGCLNGALRIFVVSGGCVGYQYGMAVTRKLGPKDCVLDFDGLKVIIDTDSAHLLQGIEIDYSEDEAISGFQIYNPNIKKLCDDDNRSEPDPNAPAQPQN